MHARHVVVETMRVSAGSMFMENVTYPQPVLDYMNETIKDLHDLFVEEKVEEHGPEAFIFLMGPVLLEQWLDTGEAECTKLPEDKFYGLITDIIVEARFRKLKSMGLLDGIEDENGEMVWFLTPVGKEVGNKLK